MGVKQTLLPASVRVEDAEVAEDLAWLYGPEERRLADEVKAALLV